ncbi:hypothetical protein BHE74_00019626, partial [Ensete ventricosum]
VFIELLFLYGCPKDVFIEQLFLYSGEGYCSSYDSKLGVISIGDRPLWNFIRVPPSLVFCTMAEK